MRCSGSLKVPQLRKRAGRCHAARILHLAFLREAAGLFRLDLLAWWPRIVLPPFVGVCDGWAVGASTVAKNGGQLLGLNPGSVPSEEYNLGHAASPLGLGFLIHKTTEMTVPVPTGGGEDSTNYMCV